MSEAPALFDRAGRLYIVPVRHHSPACAWHLGTLIDEVRPAAVLIEGPADFDSLIPLITDGATRPPVAIVALAQKHSVEGERRRVVSYFPLSAHSPEYVALKAAQAAGIPARFIDLPSQDRAMTDDGMEDTASLIDERVFDTSAYVKALMSELRCRDGNEVWDHLFETRIARGAWERFFLDVGVYCRHLRECTAPARIAADGTLAREAQMRACIAEERQRRQGPIVVVVGGFHAPALVGPDPGPGSVRKAKGSSAAYLIRYGNRQLNALSGYAAGLPLPAYYEKLWDSARNGAPFDDLATELILGFGVHLRAALPSWSVPVPVLAAALENARRLAALRGRPGPLRDDILDACRSALLKGEEGGDEHPVIAELLAWLTGSALGDVPVSAGSPPLVEAARAQGRALGFIVTDGEWRNRDLDIYRNEKHRRASQFLHAMAFLETDFCRRTAGPDLRTGVDLDRLHETWSVAWSPVVEARLVELSGTADTVAGAVVAEIGSKLEALRAEGSGHDAVAAIALFTAACQAGVDEEVDGILPVMAEEIANDPSLASIAEALRDLIGLWRNRALLGIVPPEAIETLLVAAWRRALHLTPDLAEAQEESVGAALTALPILREAIELASGEIAAIDGSLFDEVVAALVERTKHPALSGAVHALACLSGHIDAALVGCRIAGGLAGGFVEAGDKVAFLRGVIAISRELLWTIPALVEEIERVLERLDHEGFIALLPHLRLAFSQLDPRDIDRLAQAIAGRRGIDAAELTAIHAVSAGTMTEMLEIDRAVLRELEMAGLA